MKKRVISIFFLLIMAVTCLSVGIAGCMETNSKRVGHITVRADSTEIVVAVGTNYTTPIAGVFDQNEDRIDGRTIITQVYNHKNNLLEESNEQIKFRFMSKGVWKIVYSAYIGEEKDTSIPDTTITAYVCSVLTAPQNFKVENNTLTWDEVANASGYDVSINGGEPVTVNEESFTSDIFEKSGYYVAVTAKGDNKSFIDSSISAYRNRIPLKDGELMAFNDPNYALDVQEAVGVGINLPPDEIEWLSEEECEGSTGGALKLRVRSGGYGWGVFKVLMPEGTTIDMNDDSWEYMEIRFKVDTESYQASTKFLLNPPNNLNNDGSRGVIVTKDYNDQWYTIQLPKTVIYAEGYKRYSLTTSSSYKVEDDLVTWDKNPDAYGYQIVVSKTDVEGNVTTNTYKNFSSDNGFKVSDKVNSYMFDIRSDATFYNGKDGSTYSAKVDCEIPTTYANLNFNFYDMIRTTGVGYAYLDYVRLYTDKIEAPQNLRYENGKILWDAVEGADKYTLEIATTDEFGTDNTRYTVDGSLNEFDLASINLDPTKVKFSASIKTIPQDATMGSSDYVTFDACLAPVGLSINAQGILSWTPADNAVGYLVSINGREYTTTETSLNIASDIAKGDVVAFVKTLGAAGYLDSELSLPCCKLKLTGSQIANFNSSAYEYMISQVAKGEQGSTAVGRINSARYVNETSAEGSNGGALDVVMSNVAGITERQRDFKISFANPLDLTGYDGISIRLKVYDASTYNYPSTPDVRFRMLQASGRNYWGTTLYATPIELNEWVTVRYTKAEVEDCLINDGTALSLQIVGYGTFPGLAGGLLKFYLDDISYYRQLSTPTNYALNGTTISWDAVSEADGYVVNVNGTDLPMITATTFDISEYANVDYAIKVRAVSNVHLESPWTQSVMNIVTSGLDIAKFNSSLYESTLKYGQDNTIKAWTGNQAATDAWKKAKSTYETGVDGAENGDALLIQPLIAHYGSGGGARHAVFTVKLPRALDLSGTYSGITIRFKPVDMGHGLGNGTSTNSTIDRIQLMNPTTKDKTYTTYYDSTNDKADYNAYPYAYLEVVEGTWYEWTITLAQLKALYSDGATELVFAMVSKGGATCNLDTPANTYLDYIKYVPANN